MNETPVSLNGTTFAVDYESFYDSKAGYSLSCMDPYAYVHDPRFDAYLVSVVSDEGEEYVGDPAGFDWNCLRGKLLLAHNAGFDGMVTNRLVEKGIIPDFERNWADTADLAAYLCVPRSLKNASRELLGIEVCKKVRSDMDGKKMSDLTEVQRQALIEYAADDSRLCMMLWQRYGDRWPETERRISKANREAGWLGVMCDRPAVIAGLAKLREVQKEAAKGLPWYDPTSPKESKKPGSRPAFIMHAHSLGLPTPASIKKDDPAMLAWIARYADQHPFIRARLTYASVTPHIARLESMLALMDDKNMLRFNLCYHGAHTGRSTGSASGEDGDGGEKFNVLNIPKDPKKTWGVDMRGMLIPRDGMKFIIFDFGQIEARIVQWIAGNFEFLKLVEKENIYQAAAKMLGWYPREGKALKKEDPATYALAKAACLGLGFSMGAAKFVFTCEKQGTVLPSDPKETWNLDRRLKFLLRNVARIDWNNPANEKKVGTFIAADKIVSQWRAANPQVVGLWKDLQDDLSRAAERGEPVHEFELASGRPKPYYRPHFSHGFKVMLDPETGTEETRAEKRLYASVIKGNKPVSLHGGVITENLVQATARDVMFFGAMDVMQESNGHWPLRWNAYDEVIFEVPDSDVDQALKVIPELMCRGKSLAWAKGLPLEVEGGPSDRYLK